LRDCLLHSFLQTAVKIIVTRLNQLDDDNYKFER